MAEDWSREAQQLRNNPLLDRLLAEWRQELVDAMLAEQDFAERDRLWNEHLNLLRLSERLESELDSIIGGGTGRELGEA
jgi:hypothetical protein